MIENISDSKSKKRLKQISINLLLLFCVVIIFCMVGELIARVFIGKVLIKNYEDDGFNYFKSNQEGWYDFQRFIKMDAKINNIGARGKNVNVSLVESTNKYVFLGDSFTFGWDLKDNETLPEHFKEIMNLSNEQVLNFGSSTYGLDHMIKSYNFNEDFIIEEDVIILTVIEHDFARKMQPLDKRFIHDLLFEIRRHSSFLSFSYSKIGPRLLSLNPEFVASRKLKVTGPFFDEGSGNKIINFEKELNSKNQTLILVFYDYTGEDYTLGYLENISAFCNMNSINCIINVPELLSNLTHEEIYGVDGGHPSSLSNSKVAKGIADFILSNKLEIN